MSNEYISSLFDVSGQVAVVTGGGGVLCGAISRAFGKAGVSVAVLDIVPEAAQAVVDDINGEGGRAVSVECNVLDKATNTVGTYWPTEEQVTNNMTEAIEWLFYTNVVYNETNGVWTPGP